jgi:hypothetical protein
MTFRATIAPTLTSRAQRLVEEYEATYGSSGPGCCPQALATVLDHLVAAFTDDESFYAVPSSVLTSLAVELRGAPCPLE